MKKILLALTVVMCFVSINVFAQEVRGIETRRVIYEGGKAYYYNTSGSSMYSKAMSTEYYGWEFKNFNSCTVSVDIYMYHYSKPSLIATKSIVLQPKESYIFKHEIDNTQARDFDGIEKTRINDYYVEFKAFKVQ